uniref:Uncharacterized protein n=1 Tax=Anguilla anguilla TaxID=7936 RepID=A0A0E9TBR1_ANGAN
MISFYPNTIIQRKVYFLMGNSLPSKKIVIISGASNSDLTIYQ